MSNLKVKSSKLVFFVVQIHYINKPTVVTSPRKIKTPMSKSIARCFVTFIIFDLLNSRISFGENKI